MNIIIKKNIMLNEFKELYNDASFKLLPDIKIIKLIKNSKYKITVYDADKLIGMGRMITDDVKMYFLCDVIVKKEYQNKKIGTLIVDTLINMIKDKNDINIHLMASEETKGFFEKLSFKNVNIGFTYNN